LKSFLLILTLAFVFLSRAKLNEIDSLEHIIETTNIDSVKVKTLYYLDGLIYISDPKLDNELNLQIAEICNNNLTFNTNLSVNEIEFYSYYLLKSYNVLGINQDNLGNYPLALDYYYKSLQIGEKMDDSVSIGGVYNNIGLIHQKLKEFSLAKYYYFKSLKLESQIKDSSGIATAYNNIGNLYLSNKKLDSALYFYNLSLPITISQESPYQTASTYGNIGVVYKDLENYDSALFYYNKSLVIRNSINDWDGLANVYSNIGLIHLNKRQQKKAIQNCLQGLHIATNNEAKYRMKQNCHCLYMAHKQVQNNDSALFYLEWHDSLDNALNTDEAMKAIAQKEIIYETGKKTFLDSLKYLNNLQVSEDKSRESQAKNNFRTKFLVGGLILLFFIGMLIYNRLKLIKRQKINLEGQHKYAQEQNSIITQQKYEIEESINYAKLIQEATLPTINHSDIFKDSFIYYNPKDVVSGDFFWLEDDSNQTYFAVGDCTGHGIPGAFISMIGTILLNEIYNAKSIKSPELVLNELNRLIQLTLDSGEAQMNDGMDISFCTFNKSDQKLSYSGANNGIWIISKNDQLNLKINDSFHAIEPTLTHEAFNLFEIKADKQPVGKYYNTGKPFNLKEVQLTDDDLVYAYTDGFSDQFGGEKGKKYKPKQLKKLLLTIAHLDLSDQKQVLDKEFTSWKKNIEQVDDVCIMGIKI
jgi:serine phosphatase RsbU (regulator of sigma subunit)